MTALPSERAPSGETALDRVIAADTSGQIPLELMGLCKRRRVRSADAEQAVGDTFAAAFTHERKGLCWDPSVEPDVVAYLTPILLNVLRVQRRSAKRKPTVFGVDDESPSDEDLADVLLIEHERHVMLAADVQKALIAETRAGLTLLILEAMRRGIEGHEELATELKCSLAEVRAAFKRIARRLKGFQAS